MTIPRALIAVLLVSVCGLRAGDLRLNEIQVIGTHNSYHVAPDEGMLKLLAAFDRDARSWDYTREPLDNQLDAGMRHFELDVFADPEGGLFARSDAPGDSPMREPGIKILHVPGVDSGTRHATLIDALETVRGWSRAHPRHLPVMILVELKDGGENPFWPTPRRFDSARMDALEAEILTVFERAQLLTPDDVRGDRQSLRAAVLEDGWPKLDALRGKVMFCLDNEDWHRDAYLEDHASLAGRLMFASVDSDHPAAAWMKRNDPVGDFEEIQSLVRAGFLVRTRADAGTSEARANDTSRRDKALASGAQFVSTDFPNPDSRFSDYCVRLPGNVVARPNPVSAPDATQDELELLDAAEQ